jgi:phage tail protein X
MDFVEYVTLEGDRWDLIAYKAYGDITMMGLITAANKSVPLLPTINEGTRLRIPVMVIERSVDNSKLPPWKR